MSYYKIDSNLRIQKMINYRRLFIIALVIIIVQLGMLICSVEEVQVEIRKIHTTDTIFVGDVPLTDSAITEELVKLGCVLPNVALAQFKLETGHFKSSICKENKNIAGIRNSVSPLVIGKNRGHCVYKSYRDCLRDYVRVQNKYLKKIDGKYAEAEGYIQELKKIK
jgi:uncharacterized FlgJ-related protein